MFSLDCSEPALYVTNGLSVDERRFPSCASLPANGLSGVASCCGGGDRALRLPCPSVSREWPALRAGEGEFEARRPLCSECDPRSFRLLFEPLTTVQPSSSPLVVVVAALSDCASPRMCASVAPSPISAGGGSSRAPRFRFAISELMRPAWSIWWARGVVVEKLKKMFGVPAHGYALAMAHESTTLVTCLYSLHFATRNKFFILQ